MENTQVEESGQSSTKYHRSARMFALRDYHLSEKVYENKKLVIHRGARKDDKMPVLVFLWGFSNRSAPHMKNWTYLI